MLSSSCSSVVRRAGPAICLPPLFGQGLLDIRNSSRRLACGLSMIDFHFADALGGSQGFLRQGTPVNADADQRAVHGVSRAIRRLVNLLLDRCKELPAIVIRQARVVVLQADSQQVVSGGASELLFRF